MKEYYDPTSFLIEREKNLDSFNRRRGIELEVNH